MGEAFAKKTEPMLYWAFAGVMALTFVADLAVPLGTAVWVLYLFPTVLAFLASRPQVPLVIAAGSTLLVIAGFLVTRAGIDPSVAQTNRTLGVLTAWILAATGYFFIRNKLAIRQQEWLQSGQVGLAEVMSGEQRIDQLGDNILTYLSSYLGAQAGALFVRQPEGFRRFALFGVPAEASIPERFTSDDGLLGQVVRSGRNLVLEDLPEDYLYFGSGLGRGKPRFLLVGVGKVSGEVNTVIELGFNRPIGEREQAFLERVADSVGVAIRSAKYRARLQELLEETQRQAEELQAQSEELRTANEELEEQSRSLQESQLRLERQQAELEQTNAQLEEQTQLLESQRDDLSRTQTVLQAQAAELEQASRYKSEFLANMSHELRTPLNSLLIMARLLADNREGNLSSEQVKYAQTIESSGNDLLDLINDILDISKIEAGRLELQVGPLRVATLAEKLKTAFQAAALQKGLRLHSEIAGDAPADLESDAQRLEQILRNFLSNAIKFTDKGEVVLSVTRAAPDRLAFTVRDTGIGIPADQQQVIFEAFRQADGTTSRKHGGTGLGLSIARELARLLGGEIRLESEVGKGSAFTLILPERYDPTQLSQPGESAALAPRVTLVPSASQALSRRGDEAPPKAVRRPAPIADDREQLSAGSRLILVVEDDPAFARILLDLAHELGFQCLVADTADEGVLLARQYLPQAVILDIGLPDHTGLSVLDRLKHDLRTRHIPVHVVSVSDYTQAALAYGAVGYMLKPVKREALVQALEGLEARMAQRVRRILIVEDDADQLESLRLLLASREVETLGVRTAAECLSTLQSGVFDCMVLDLSLPDASGLEVLERLSQDPQSAFPPVIVYTGRDLSSDEELQLRRFSKSIIIKGAKSPERLLDEVTLFLHQVVSDLPESLQKMLARSLNRDAVLEGRQILVVEDDVRNVFSLTSVLEPHGAKVRIARSGREALEMLEQMAQGVLPPPDLVLMDVMMPEMDGLTAIRQIRRQPHWKDLPIITLTAKAMAGDQEQCLAAGANDYLAKPLDVDKLLSLVRVWIRK